MGHIDSGGTMANLFINGEYKGYFNPCEHTKDAFCQEWYNSDEEWDVMTMNGVRDGDSVSWNNMINYARNNNLSEDTNYEQMSRFLDIPAFADYLILQLWCGNWDWPQNNWAAACERKEDGGFSSGTPKEGCSRIDSTQFILIDLTAKIMPMATCTGHSR
jgi:hypothetical protein